LASLLVVIVFSACCYQKTAPTEPRPTSWAERIPSQFLQNWYKLDEDVYRSEQPSRAGFEEIRDHGIKTIFDLRSSHRDDSKAAGLGFKLVRVPMTAWGFTEADVVAALKVIKECPKPVLIHCHWGADRTGLVSAMFRVVFQGWSKEEAIAELRGGGFGFHSRYSNMPKFIREVNVDKIKKDLGIAPEGGKVSIIRRRLSLVTMALGPDSLSDVSGVSRTITKCRDHFNKMVTSVTGDLRFLTPVPLRTTIIQPAGG
jgi:protein tyrosine phosphatase (PTP) superfamily phosphohydrolase (DUF442 family)